MKWQIKTRWNCVALVRGWGGADNSVVQLEAFVDAADKQSALVEARARLVERFVADEKIVLLGVKRMKI